MRILQINKFLYPRGGADKHFLDVVELLQERGHRVAVFSMKHQKNFESRWQKYFLSYVGYNREDSNFWEKIKGVGRMFYSFEANKKINQLLDDFDPEIVHIHNIYHQLSPCILFEIKKRNIPVVMTVHDYKLVNPNHSLFLNGKFYNRCREGKFYQCFLDKCVKDSYLKSLLATLESYWHKWLGTYEKNIDLYVAPSVFVRKILIERGINPGKIIVMAHFSENNKISAGNKKPKARHALYFGRISKEKGVDMLIDIFNELKIPLYLVGAIEGNFEMRKSKFIKHLGFMEQAELKKEIAAADLVVSGSRLPETFGLVALEALSLGRPFVGFNSGAFSQIVENEKEGFICKDRQEFTESVKRIWEDEELRQYMSKKAIEKAGKFTKNEYAVKLEGIFKSLRRR
ncbi:MAG: glycosyltransferase [Candidatus Moranbacteria bacterium]|nr:glycosyltransferase [Candidatus Moranbacteria bacterium]